MKNPNGYGTVRKLSGNRRRPWVALAPERQVPGQISPRREVIGYFEKREDAMSALGAWNKIPNPLPSDKAKMTLEELYKEYKVTRRYKNLSKQTKNCYIAAWAYFDAYKKSRVRDLRTAHFQAVIDAALSSGKSQSTAQKIKVLAGILCDYAVQTDIIDKNYAQFTSLPRAEKSEKRVFTDIDLQKLETAAANGIMYSDLILLMCYTGWRINEFLTLTRFAYNAQNKTLTGGSKTEAGKNRVVPVPPKVQPYLDKWLALGGDTIICRQKGDALIPLSASYFRRNWFYPTLAQLGIDEELTPHATRHTYASMLHKAGADKWDIQRLMGHSSAEVTNNVYTHVDLEQLKKAANLL